MANYTKTITNTCRFFGIEPTEKWATFATSTSNLSAMVWGTDNWAFGTVGMSYIWTEAAGIIVITNTVGLTSDAYRLFIRTIPNSFSVTNTVGKGFYKYVDNSQVFTSTVGFSADFSRLFAEDLTLVDTRSREATYNILYGESLSPSSSQGLTLKRDNYTIIVGGKSNATEWPRGSSWTVVARPS